jgi:hypothetical protein
MTVRKAKKILKAMKDDLHPDKPAYVRISWNHKRKKGKYFLVDTLHGDRQKILL